MTVYVRRLNERLVQVALGDREFVATSVERALHKALASKGIAMPDDVVWHAAEVLGSLLPPKGSDQIHEGVLSG